MKIRLALPVAAAALALSLTGCSTDPAAPGGSGPTSTSAEAGVVADDADVMFLQMMYPHHAQAVEMADLVAGRTQDPAVLDLAAEISAAQGPEMATMTDLLASFGEPAPSPDAGMGEMGGTGGSSMSGMMTPDEMSALAAASGAEFDRRWLTMMVAHHTGAVEMAEAELADGTNPDARRLATDIIAAQQAEIETMTGLLAGA